MQFWFISDVVLWDNIVFPMIETALATRHGLFAVVLLLLLVWQTVLYIAFWHYYDSIDDRSFNVFCRAPRVPHFFRDPAYLAEFGLSAVGGAAIFCFSLFPLAELLLPPIPRVLPLLLAFSIGAGIAGGLSVLRLRRLNETWSIQKDLRKSTDKRPRIVRRILYAVIFFVAVLIASALSIVLVPGIIGLVATLLISYPGVLIAILCVLGGIVAFFLLRHAIDRRKFLRRLAKMRDRGELSFTVHGHPYLSLFSKRVPFSLTVIDEPHPESRIKTPTTYQVAVANCGRRRLTVILCEDNVFQIMHSFGFRMVVRNAGVFGMGEATVVHLPAGAFFTTRGFDFPEGEGKRILLVDPAPHNLCIRDHDREGLVNLDNASEVFGYTVYGKHSFLRVLERI